MISIKVQCVCGQKFAFEIEPVYGRMPQRVNCPVCGTDGTAAANEIIAQILAAQTVPAPARSLQRSVAPAAAPIPAAALKTPVGKPKMGLWIGVGAGVVALAAAVAGFVWLKQPSAKGQGADRAVTVSTHDSQPTKTVALSPVPPGDGGKNQQGLFPPTELPLPAGAVDTLDYMLQGDDANGSWITHGPEEINGTSVRVDRDPDGTDTPTFVITKWENPRLFEVYKVTTHEIQSRYESQSAGPKEVRARRFEEHGGEGEAPGGIWLKRVMTPGGPGFFTSGCLDLFVLDPKTGIGKLVKSGSVQNARSYVSIAWVTNEQGGKSPFEGKPVIRRFDEWSPDGAVFEAYDYAYRNGPVGWHWYERVSTLRPMEGDSTRQVFHCESGYVLVASKGSDTAAPEVYQFDPVTKTRIKPLRVIRFTSHITPALGEQWYVIYRDTGDDFSSLQKKPGRTAHDFSIPEWTQKPGATIADIPCLYTHMPARTNHPVGDVRIEKPGASPAMQDQGTSLENRLKKLKDQFDQGLITKEVYDQQRQEILKSL